MTYLDPQDWTPGQRILALKAGITIYSSIYDQKLKRKRTIGTPVEPGETLTFTGWTRSTIAGVIDEMQFETPDGTTGIFRPNHRGIPEMGMYRTIHE